MAFIDDFTNAIKNYATDNCKTEIVNFSILPPGGAILNVGDRFRFQVKVTNEKHLSMKNVRLRAIGTGFADVGLNGAVVFGPTADSSTFDLLDSGSSHTTGFFNGKAKAKTPGTPPTVQDIVTAQIVSWNADLSHILIDHSVAGAAEGKLNRAVSPT